MNSDLVWPLATWFIWAGIMAGQGDKNADPNPEPAKQQQPALHATNGEQRQAKPGNDSAKPESYSPTGNASLERPQVWWRDANWWLVIIAGLTGGFIGWQSWETRKAAEGAKESGEAFINAERAWIMIETIWPYSIDQNVEKQMAMGKPFFAIIEFKNYGSSPAWITQSCAFLKLGNDEMFKNPLEYGNPPPYPTQYPLSPAGTERNKLSIRVEWEGGGFGNFAELRKMKDEGTYPILYGFVKYRDPFPNTIREREPGISFCYRYDFEFSAWRPWGPSGVNEST